MAKRAKFLFIEIGKGDIDGSDLEFDDLLKTLRFSRVNPQIR